MKEAQLRELIRKYLNDECTPYEKREVEHWYASFENDTDLMEVMTEPEREKLRSIMFDSISENIRGKESIIARRRSRFVPLYVAAGVAALLAIAIGLRWLVSVSQTPEFTSTKRVVQITLENQEKHIKRVPLPDSSLAWLHPNSSITYSETFAAPERRISMTGEVFFDVKPDAQNPFVVYSRNLRTTVLGTSFRIRAYNNSPFTKVSVMTGKVAVERVSDTLLEEHDKISSANHVGEVILLPAESLVFSEEKPDFRKEKNEAGEEMGMWRKGNLAFSDIPVKDVIRKLNAVYDIRITTDSREINEYLLKADFTGMNLPDVLEVLSLSLDLTYELDQNVITLKKAPALH